MKRIWVITLVVFVVLVTVGCSPQSVQLLPNPSGVPGALNVAYAQQATEDITPTPSLSPLPFFSDEPAPTDDPAPPVESPIPAEDPSAWDIKEGDKIVYLTFDDGPSKNTEQILEILASEQVPATFFMLGENMHRNPDKVKAIAQQGHLVANHSYTHVMGEIYASQEALLAEIEQTADEIKSILGQDYPTDLFRFPGGSTAKRCRDYREGVVAAGYRYFDWNALNGDAETGKYKRTPEELLERLKQTVQDVDGRKKEVVVLMHDTNSKGNTVLMLQEGIRYLKELGYEFRTMEHAKMH